MCDLLGLYMSKIQMKSLKKAVRNPEGVQAREERKWGFTIQPTGNQAREKRKWGFTIQPIGNQAREERKWGFTTHPKGTKAKKANGVSPPSPKAPKRDEPTEWGFTTDPKGKEVTLVTLARTWWKFCRRIPLTKSLHNKKTLGWFSCDRIC